MIRRVLRGLLAAMVILVLVYLTANVALNFTPLRSGVASAVERESGSRVEVGYFFLNWKLQPVMNSMTLTEVPARDGSSRAQYELNHLILTMNWSRFFDARTARLQGYVKAIHVREAEVRYRLNQGSGEDRQGPPRIDLPVSVGSWVLTIDNNSRELLRLSGRKLRYSGPERPIETMVTGYQHQSAAARVQLSPGPEGWSARADVERMSFSNDVWQIHGDQWSGQFRFDGRSDTPSLTARLSGTPGRVGGVELPEVNLRSELLFTGNQVLVEDFSTRSGYFRSALSGSVRSGGEKLSLEGNFAFDLKDHLNHVLSARLKRVVQVRESNTLQGTLTVGGSISDPDLNGLLELSGAQVLVETRGGTSVVELSDLKGKLEQGRLSLSQAQVREGTKSFSLDNGFVEAEDGRVTLSITGSLTMNPEQAPPNAFFPGRSQYLKNFRDVKLPMNFSGTFGMRDAETVFAVRDGKFRYGPGVFERGRLIYSYSTSSTRENSLRASVVDPDGNLWKISGPTHGPYTLEGRPEQFHRWIRFYTPYTDEVPLPSFKGLRVRSTVSSLEDLYRSEFTVTTEPEANLELAGTTVPLRGSIRGDSAEVLVEELGLRAGYGQLTTRGRIRPERPLGRSQLDLDLSADNFLITLLTSQYPGLEGTRVSGNFEGTGPIAGPSVRGRVRFDTLSYHFLDLRDLGAKLDYEDGETLLSGVEGTINGGKLMGGVRFEGLRQFQLDGRVRNVNLSDLFPSGSWMYRNSSGLLTTRFQVSGTPGELSSLSGKIRGRFDQLILAYFPQIEGIEQIARPEVLENPILIDPFAFEAPVRNGQIVLDGVTLQSEGMDLNINGVIDLEGDVDLELDLVLKDEALRGFLQDVFGEVYRRVGIGNKNELTIPLEVRGDIESPKLIVRRSEVNTNFRKNLVENLLSRPIGKPINELLDELFFVD